MASQRGPTSPAPVATTTAITAICDDLLCEIFLRLPSLPSLVRAALACRAFLHAVRSSPAFRRRFRAVHPPQILGFFNGQTGIHSLIPLDGRSDHDLAAAVHGSDFRFIRLPKDRDESRSRWEILNGCRDRCGYVFLCNEDTNQIAAYNPLKWALYIFPYPPQQACDPHCLDFHIIFSEDGQRSFRVVCVQQKLARFSVFLSDSREWQSFSWVAQPGYDGGDNCVLSSYTDTVMNEFDRLAFWKDKNTGYIVVLNTVTLQISRMDLPQPLKDKDSTQFELGRTNAGKLCMVCADGFGADKTMIAVWIWRADGDGVDRWMQHKVFPLNTFIDVTTCSAEYGVIVVQVVVVIDGFVFLCIDFGSLTKFFLSFCLETENVNEFFNHTFHNDIHPYIMAWPPSLLSNKENSETNITGGDATDDGPMGTEETLSVLGGGESIQTIRVQSPLKITVLLERRNLFNVYCS
ncbi:hypothetical protein CFC21_079033 [Triticum aestivum]|uniref:F-box protein AT5G49610-like beta-propeller domain-containing protein n=3 Tax=Triticinae TaxID=1648030 RepID=A0A9R1HZ90_WHEAT|nr:uncharacterized protein LOC123125344 [Triticum aestivum]KAF7074123.1 hypothetical protein CFC21_079033 [Triticum aestivum]